MAGQDMRFTPDTSCRSGRPGDYAQGQRKEPNRQFVRRDFRISKEDAHRQVLAAWQDWTVENGTAGMKLTDTYAHVFLRQLKAEQPKLFTFTTRGSAYEVAFRWLLDAGSLVE